ncbi:unnamed protein product [Moneuplotes crassus]|uniref:WD40 repeat-containing protein SMU1 n=1 Tax=Euplotes crassus TaxID=5936 RepID=A0AAD1XBL8_EUPCR|nr:unnamed protein product [Moneuplotes crassus]
MIYTFLEDNGYAQSLNMLQKESEFGYLIPKIKSGEWEAVLAGLSRVNLNEQLLYDLYEQIVFELVEEGDSKIGLVLLQQPGVQSLRESHQDDIKKLISLCTQGDIDMQVIYDQEEKGDRQERRERLAAMFREAFTLFDENTDQFGLFKLLSVGQQDDDSDEVPLEILKKKKPQESKEEEKDLTKVEIRKPYLVKSLVQSYSKNVGDDKEIECISLCPTPIKEKEYLAVGFVDGVIEVWNRNTLDVAKGDTFVFQAEGKFMGHNSHILHLEFSENGKVLASGDSEGTIKVWNFEKGKCVKKIEKAHTDHGITCVRFNDKLSIVYSSSFDTVLKSHGLKNTSLLKEYKGHSGQITEFHLMEDQDRMISASGDGTLRIWNLISTSCVKIINPLSLDKNESNLLEVAVINFERYPDLSNKQRKNWGLVCLDNSNMSFLIDIKTSVLVTSFYNDKPNTSYLYSTFDEDGKYVICPCSDGYLYVFDTPTGKMISMMLMLPLQKDKNLLTKLVKLDF